jgi:adenylylsulfate kinase-like enzyme
LVHNVSGLDDPYEHPLAPDLVCRTDRETLEESAAKVLDVIERRLAR